jgi:uncharacterized membrane protein YeiH
MHGELLAHSQAAFNLVGTFVFGVSGALLAVRKRFDVVGMTVLAEITALGGGILRDLVIGAVPPAAFTSPWYLLLPFLATAVTFFAHAQMRRIHAGVLVFDAMGLGAFSVAGTAKALAHGLGPVPAVALGVITAVGGGVLRDVLANDPPAIFRADGELYAVPALLGACLVVLAHAAGMFGPLAAVAAAVVVFALRMVALRYGWRAPRPEPRRRAPYPPSRNLPS